MQNVSGNKAMSAKIEKITSRQHAPTRVGCTRLVILASQNNRACGEYAVVYAVLLWFVLCRLCVSTIRI